MVARRAAPRASSIEIAARSRARARASLADAPRETDGGAVTARRAPRAIARCRRAWRRHDVVARGDVTRHSSPLRRVRGLTRAPTRMATSTTMRGSSARGVGARGGARATRGKILRRATSSASDARASDSSTTTRRYGVEERYWTWEGHRIRYTTSGASGPAMVLVHGFGGNCDHWRRNVNELGETRRVFAIDLLGYGYSDKPNPMAEGLRQNEIYCFETWGRQIGDFIDEVVGEPAFVACNSVGGVAGLQVAVDAPEKVRGLALINISLRGLHVTKQPAIIRPFVKAFQQTLRETALGKSFFASVAKPRTVRNILKEAYGDSAQVTDELVEAILTPGLRDGAAEVFLDFISYSGGPLPEELLPKCKVPVRMLWGDKDPWENIDQGRKLYASYADKFIPLPGVGHCPQDEAPALVNKLLNEFVDEYAPSSG